MRRSVCYTEPSQVLAGSVGTWNFLYTTASDLPKGTKLKFDLSSDGRPMDWEYPSADPDAKENAIYALLESGKTLYPVELQDKRQLFPTYEFTLPEKIEMGKTIAIVIGTPKGKKETKESGNKAQTIAERRRAFYLYIDTSGKGKYGDPELFTVDIRGNALQNIRALTPSFVVKNRRFDVVIRFEDEFNNVTGNAPDDTLIELSYENIRENLNWKIFVPETGFISLPNLYFNEAGIYTIQLKNLSTGEVFYAPPIKCFNEREEQLFWGLLHGESERIDSAENIEGCLRHFRDEKALNFYGISSFEDIEETSNEIWKLCLTQATEFDESDRFTTFLGFQWTGDDKTEGHRIIVYSKEGKQLQRKKESKSSSLKKMYKNALPKDFISIPSFTMASGYSYDFNDWNPEFERVAEIYNSWGCSETTEKNGNLLPIAPEGNKGIKEDPTGSLIEALKKGCRFGFVAGGLDDRGIYSNLYESEQVQYHPGLTAIITKEHNRNSLFEALYARRCYATTGARIIIDYNIALVPMGGEISTEEKPGLLVNRNISGSIAGTSDLERVEILRNGEVLHEIVPESGYHIDFDYDDMVPLQDVTLKDPSKKEFVFYYVRAFQKDGHIAWGSPIWIDYDKESKLERSKKKIAVKAPKKLSF